METLTAFVPLIPLFYSIYGLIRKQRFFFLLGYCLFAFLIIFSEFSFFLENGEFYHLLISSVFVIQFIISYPNTFKYFGGKVFKSFALKTSLNLILLNIFGFFVVLNNPNISSNGLVFHIIFAVLPFPFYYLMLNNKFSVFTSASNTDKNK